MSEFRSEMTGTPGAGVDRLGNSVLDPTKNVLDLVSAAIKRQDDLREAEAQHIRELATLRAEYDSRLASAESARIDAIRAVDVGNVQRAAEVQADQANALAAQVTASAEAMRNQVAAAAVAAATSLNAALDPIQKRIDDLTRAQYEAQGQKTQVVETRAAGGSIGMWAAVIVGALALAASLYLGTRTTGPALVPVQPVTVTVPK